MKWTAALAIMVATLVTDARLVSAFSHWPKFEYIKFIILGK